MDKISVVVPVYQSESIVDQLCGAFREALSDFDYEIVLVNDCSTDNSWSAIEKEAGKDGRIRAINLRVNVGQDRAIMAGLNYVSGDFVVIMDDDLQHQPSDIPALLAQIQKGSDVVYANFLEKKQTPLKNLMSWGAGKVAEQVLKKSPEIYMSPFKAIRREVVDQILQYRGPFPYIDGLIHQATSRIDQVTVNHHPRLEGETTHSFWKQAGLFVTLSTNFSVLPLRLVSVLGAVCVGLGFVLGFYFLAIYLIKGLVINGWVVLVLINLLIGGVLMFSLGVIGEYIGRILINVNKAPQFVVKQTLNIPASSELI